MDSIPRKDCCQIFLTSLILDLVFNFYDHDSTAIRLKLSQWFKFVSTILPFCFALQCVQTKASGSDLHVKLPHETLLSISLTNKELKQNNKLQASQSMFNVYRSRVRKIALAKTMRLAKFLRNFTGLIVLIFSEIMHVSQSQFFS